MCRLYIVGRSEQRACWEGHAVFIWVACSMAHWPLPAGPEEVAEAQTCEEGDCMGIRAGGLSMRLRASISQSLTDGRSCLRSDATYHARHTGRIRSTLYTVATISSRDSRNIPPIAAVVNGHCARCQCTRVRCSTSTPRPQGIATAPKCDLHACKVGVERAVNGTGAIHHDRIRTQRFCGFPPTGHTWWWLLSPPLRIAVQKITLSKIQCITCRYATYAFTTPHRCSTSPSESSLFPFRSGG